MSERLEEIKHQLEESNSYDDNPNGYWYHNINWLIEQAEQVDSMAHVIKVKNKEMRKLSNFINERNIPLKELSPLITVMNYVQEVEEESQGIIDKSTSERMDFLEHQNKRYREALEFYSDKNNYTAEWGSPKWIVLEEGEKARKALEEEMT